MGAEGEAKRWMHGDGKGKEPGAEQLGNAAGASQQQQPSPSLQSSMLPVMLPVRHLLCCNSRCWQLAAPDAVLITVGRQGIAAAAAAAG